MLCRLEIIKILKDIRTINLWDLLTGIPAGMSAFVMAALAGTIIGDVEVGSTTFLWLLALGSALIAILVGISRGAHATPSAFLQGLFTVGASLWLWVSVYTDPMTLLGITPILFVLLIVPIMTALKARDLRRN